MSEINFKFDFPYTVVTICLKALFPCCGGVYAGYNANHGTTEKKDRRRAQDAKSRSPISGCVDYDRQKDGVDEANAAHVVHPFANRRSS
jgi:hypothetical protein